LTQKDGFIQEFHLLSLLKYPKTPSMVLANAKHESAVDLTAMQRTKAMF
jgi:hypothetical protein